MKSLNFYTIFILIFLVLTACVPQLDYPQTDQTDTTKRTEDTNDDDDNDSNENTTGSYGITYGTPGTIGNTQLTDPQLVVTPAPAVAPTPLPTPVPTPTPTVKPKSALNYSLPSTKSTTINLANDGGRITLLVIGRTSCPGCGEVVENLVGELRGGTRPTKINIVSVENDDNMQLIKDFQISHHVPWDVVQDIKGVLYSQFCPENLIPCILVHDPAFGITFHYQGLIEARKIIAITGPWY